MVHTHTQRNSIRPRKKGILPFATLQMDLEGNMLSEISQAKKDKYFVISRTCGI